MPALDFQQIHAALETLSRRLGERGVKGEVCLFGGAAFILAFRSRQSTNDIDAIFVPTSVVRELVAQIGQESGYGEGWFNDGVKGFLSEQHTVTAADLPQFENLAVTMPIPEYLLAMKCMAARVGFGESKDEQDARFLVKKLNLPDAQSVMRIVEYYYPASQIPPRTRYFIETLFYTSEEQ